MHDHDIPFRAYRTEVCDLCHCALDLESGFVFDPDPTTLVHPDCWMYYVTYGKKPMRGVVHTCGDARCVKPDHLVPVDGIAKAPSTATVCRHDVEMLDRPGGDVVALGCSPDEAENWWADHFHALVDGIPCICFHDTAPAANAAHSIKGA